MAISIPPAVARLFRAAVGKCRQTRARDPAGPLVLARTRVGVLTLFANLGEVGLSLTVPGANGSGSAVIPLRALENPNGIDLSQSHADEAPTLPDLPDTLVEMPPTFLSAMHEAGRSAAHDECRYALTRIQIQGKAGQIIGTDGKQALIQGGFTLPFTETILVPAIPLFGMKDVAAQADVRIGKTATHLVVTAGPWTVWLLLDTEGRFPNVVDAVPRSRMTTTLEVGRPQAFLETVRALPAGTERDPSTAITLDLGRQVVVRSRGAADAPAAEVVIADAVTVGPPLVAAVDRQHWQRALALGFHKFRFVSPDKPWVATDPSRTYLAAGLDPSAAVGSGLPETSNAVALPPSPAPTRRTMMPARDTPVPSRNGHADPPPPTGDLIDPLAEAEALRAALTEAAGRAARLVAFLKQFRRERRALATAWSSLKQLNLGS